MEPKHAVNEVMEVTRLIPLKDVAEDYLNVSLPTVRRMALSGELPSRKMGRLVVVRADDLQNYIDNLPHYVDTIQRVA